MNYTTALIQLPLVCEPGKQKIVSPADAYELCRDLIDLAQETFHVITLNTRNALLNRHMVSLGVIDTAIVHPREVFLTAIRDQSNAIIVVHNHPSGDPTPSSDDVKITRQLVEAGKIIGIQVLDHVIIGKVIPPTSECPGFPGYKSLREGGVVEFT